MKLFGFNLRLLHKSRKHTFEIGLRVNEPLHEAKSDYNTFLWRHPVKID